MKVLIEATIILVAWFGLLVQTQSFTLPAKAPSRTSLSDTAAFQRRDFALEARKAKKGSLGSLAEDGLVTKSSKVRKPKRTASTSSSKAKSGTPSGISPALADWMAQQESPAPSTEITTDIEETSNDATATFQAFGNVAEETTPSKKKKGGSSSRRIKQSERKEIEEREQAQIKASVERFKTVLEESNNNLDEILGAVQDMLDLGKSLSTPTSLRTLFSGKSRYNYRLAWVGSDDAICHVGTGLHKVPLARLQEVFWSNLGKNRMEWLEVIRLLGPFPNVKNILQGNTQLATGNDGMTIVMDSMVDGTGKEILAGTDDNIRRVSLQICFADAGVMVAAVPREDGAFREDPLEESGKHILVFVQEPELDDKLDALRVS